MTLFLPLNHLLATSLSQRMSCLDGISDSMDVSLSKLQEIEKGREAWHAALHGVAKSWT